MYLFRKRLWNLLSLASLLLLGLPASARADSQSWTNGDTTRQALVLTTFAIDAAQTLDIKRHQGMWETNPILGKHPSDGKVIGYFLGAAIAHTAVAAALPKPYREYFQNGTIALEIAVIGNNKRLGLKVKF